MAGEIKMKDQTTLDKEVDKLGFDNVYILGMNEEYPGNAEKLMLVWNAGQIPDADTYREKHFRGVRTDIAVCELPDNQLGQIGRARGMLYFFGEHQPSTGRDE